MPDSKTLFAAFASQPELDRLYSSVKEPIHSDTRFLLNYWRAKEVTGGFEIGKDIPSRPLAKILRDLLIYEPVADSSDYRVRLAGSGLISHYGRDITGLLMSEVFDSRIVPHHQALAREVLSSNMYKIFDVDLFRQGIAQYRYEIVLLPVWSPGRVQRWLLFGAFKF